ncbi:heavy-metal-associated domain-containing protein [Jiella avicenniae]|uniref:Heavy-metal-associated domain-containing protein n=1 Tax=Jiella avicenniae TaxID=2907202 RepID=A0A9X1T6T7_9HYPH|nr:heavy-metal-associated domain-containing protein [Jiella avicenniae]MCE7029725.1 heavy-metal-associated domain-containing protein [Jiella avicenniae]
MQIPNPFKRKSDHPAGTADAAPLAFAVADMSCGHCEAAIRKELASALPNRPVSVDRGSKRVEVAAPAEEAETAAEAIRAAGYTPEPIAGSPAAS